MVKPLIAAITASMVLFLGVASAAQKSTPVYKSKEEALSRFHALDRDKTNTISANEWKQGGLSSAEFDKVDANDNNTIDEKEFLLARD